ncbi:MAG: C39 family peptidase [Verrucomicrobiae bacterium]|nr:C39 family peptidase [Verrucomicrobiae bacterium]
MSRPRLRILLPALTVLLILGGLVFIVSRRPRPAPPSTPFPARGGVFFSNRLELTVPVFFQDDPRWAQHPIGHSGSTLGPEGCAVASAAMALAAMGIDTDPGRLNAFLSTNSGYTDRGWIHWEKAAELAPDRVWKSFEDTGNHQVLDDALLQGLTPIIRIRFPSGITHFVVIAGKEGDRYLIRDPASRHGPGPHFLDSLYPGPIEGVRLYSPVAPGRP